MLFHTFLNQLLSNVHAKVTLSSKIQRNKLSMRNSQLLINPHVAFNFSFQLFSFSLFFSHCYTNECELIANEVKEEMGHGLTYTNNVLRVTLFHYLTSTITHKSLYKKLAFSYASRLQITRLYFEIGYAIIGLNESACFIRSLIPPIMHLS